jgi:hypothetical protein
MVLFQSNVEDRLPAVLKLEEESRSLREFHVLDIEVPGQYFNDQVIFTSLLLIMHCMLSRFLVMV